MIPVLILTAVLSGACLGVSLERYLIASFADDRSAGADGSRVRDGRTLHGSGDGR